MTTFGGKMAADMGFLASSSQSSIPHLSLPCLNLQGGRSAVLNYFKNTWELTEILFSSLVSEEFRTAIGNRIFGCDDCQLVCPWNKFSKPTTEKDFSPRHKFDDIKLIELFGWSEQEFERNTQGSPIRRIGYECWKRNIATALGNAETSHEVVAALNSELNKNSPICEIWWV